VGVTVTCIRGLRGSLHVTFELTGTHASLECGPTNGRPIPDATYLS
jgi:hypothetical protein